MVRAKQSMQLWKHVQSWQRSPEPASTHALSPSFSLFKTLVVSCFLCTSRWKPLKMGNETLWFYCDSILQHTVQQCTEVHELPAWWYVASVISLGQSFTVMKLSCFQDPRWVPWMALPCAVVPAPFTFLEMAQFFSSAALSVDVPGQASMPMSVRGKLALTA